MNLYKLITARIVIGIRVDSVPNFCAAAADSDTMIVPLSPLVLVSQFVQSRLPFDTSSLHGRRFNSNETTDDKYHHHHYRCIPGEEVRGRDHSPVAAATATTSYHHYHYRLMPPVRRSCHRHHYRCMPRDEGWEGTGWEETGRDGWKQDGTGLAYTLLHHTHYFFKFKNTFAYLSSSEL